MTQHDNILIVPVPEGSWAFEEHYSFLDYLTHRDEYCMIDLPPGPWRIVGRAKELKEEQWKTVVRKVFDTPPLYANYGEPVGSAFMPAKTATKSGHSLLRSKGIDPESNPLILVKEK